MSNLIKTAKKVFTFGVVITTALWSVGAAAVPGTANAAAVCPTLQEGDQLKAVGKPAIYVYTNGKLMYWPTGDYYKLWTQNNQYTERSWLDVTTECIDSLPVPSSTPLGMNPPPGTLVSRPSTSDTLYVVVAGNKRVEVSEQTAKALYGDNYSAFSIDPIFWPNLLDSGMSRVDSATPELSSFPGMVFEMDNKTYAVNDDGDMYKEVTATGKTANLLNPSRILGLSSPNLTGLGLSGNTITASDNDLNNPAQGAHEGSGDSGTTVSGPLTLALSSQNPAGSSIAAGANTNMLALDFTAGSKAVSISKLHIKKTGLSTSSDIENLKLVDSTGLLIGNLVSAIGSDDLAKFNFPKKLEIPANTTKTYFVRAGVPSSGSTTGNIITLGINSASDVITDGGGAVSGNFPITGNGFEIVGTTVGTVQVTNDGTVVDETPDAGDTDVVLNKFKLTVGSAEGVVVESMTFLESGTAGLSDYQNLELYDNTNDKSLGTVSSWNADGKAHFGGLNLAIEKGKTYRLELRTDVVSGAGLTMNADLTDGSDVLMSVKGDKFNFFLSPSVTGSWTGKGGTSTAVNQTINSGTLNVSLSSESPATGNIAADDEVLVGVFDFEAKGEPILITQLLVNVDLGTMAVTEVTNMKVKDAEGNIVAGPADPASVSGGGEATFSDNFTVPVGHNDYYVYVKIADAVSTGDTIQTDIDAAADVTAKGFNTGDSVTPTVSSAAAKTLTVQAGTMTATTLTQPAARNVVAGVQDLVWMTGSISANNSGEDLKVQTIVIENSGYFTDLDNVEIWADLTSGASSRGDQYETRVSDSNNPTASTTSFTLTNKFLVQKNSTVRIAVVADLAAGASAGNTHALFFDTDSGDVSATGATTGTTVNATPTGSGQTFTVSAAGTLTVTVNSDWPSTTPWIAHGLQQGVTLAKFKMAANNAENLDIDSIKITDDGSDDTVDTYYFYAKHGTSAERLLGSVPGGATAEIFLADGAQNVPVNDNIVLTVKADFAGVDGTTVANGDNVIPTLAAAGDIDTTGESSGSAVDLGSGDLVNGPSTTVYDAIPVVAFSSDTPGGTLVPNTNHLIAKIKVTAKGNDDITFENADGNSLTVAFSSSNSSNQGAVNFVLKDAETGTTLDTISQNVTSTSAAFDFSTNSLTIAEGTTKTLNVYVDTSGMTTTGNTIQAWLNDDDADNIDWGINGSGSFNHAHVIFRGDLFGGAFSKS